MRPDSPSTRHESPPRSDAEDYPVWKRWGELDAHSKSKSDERETSEGGVDPVLLRKRIEELEKARALKNSGPDEPSTTRASVPRDLTDERRRLEQKADAVPIAPERRSWESDFSALDIRDRVVIMLLFKQIVQIEDVEAAWRRFQESNEVRLREPLWRVLVRDPHFDREQILCEAARTAGYEEAEIDPEDAASFLTAHFDRFTEAEWERMLHMNVVPVAREKDPKTSRDRMVFIAPDPTRPGVIKLIRDLEVDGYVLRYAPERLIDSLLAHVTGRGAPPQQREPFSLRALPRDSAAEPAKASKHESADPADPPAEIAEEGGAAVDETAEAEQMATAPEADSAESTLQEDSVHELFEQCLTEAVSTGASGVHMLPVKDGLQIDMRVQGELRRWQICPKELGDRLLSVVKESALNIEPTDLDSAQDGLIERRIGEATVHFRVSVLPIAADGAEEGRESVVISSIGESTPAADLSALGLPEEVLDHLRRSLVEPRGVVVLAGPPGSGRSTTLGAILQEIITPKVNVITLEESVSHLSREIRQVRLSRKLDHEDALEAVRRHDPDVILVGELRTKEAAELALKLANAGHRVFARMPAHDTSSVIGRLFRLDVDPFLTAYAINVIVAQRLVRRLCPDCREPSKHVDGELLKRLGFSRQEIASTTFFGEGTAPDCATCGGRRYHGTQIIAEAMPLSQAIRRSIALAAESFDDEDVRAQAVREGMTTIRASAREVVLQGETSIDEMIRATAGGG